MPRTHCVTQRIQRLFFAAAVLLASSASTAFAQGSFAVTSSPSTVTLYPGGSATFTVKVTGTSGSPVSVIPTGLPTGITATPAELTLAAGASGTFTLRAALNADAAAFPSTSATNPNTATTSVYLAAVSGGVAEIGGSLNVAVSLSDAAFLPTQVTLPVLRITTTGGTAITSQTTSVAGSVVISSADGSTVYFPSASAPNGAASFELYGSTTSLMPKKPYAMQLSTSTDLLSLVGLKCPYVTGAGAPTCAVATNYLLLANYDDKSLLRNWAASALANAIPIGNGYLAETAGSPTPSGTSQILPWAPHSVYVELYVNNAYLGNYQLIEQVSVNPNRVNIPTLSDSQTTGDLSGGYLTEIDHVDTPAFTTTQGLPVDLLSPDFTPAVPEQLSYISGAVDAAEGALFGSSFTSPTTGWRAYFDEASLVNFYIVNEVMGNVNGGSFNTSDYFYKTADNPLLYMGPVSDFEISAGNTNYESIASPLGPWVATNALWYEQLFKDPTFAADVATQWNALKSAGVLTQWLAAIQAQGAALSQSAQNNFTRWPILGETVWPNLVARDSYTAEVTNLTDWLGARMAYLDAQFNRRAASSVTILSGPAGSVEGTPTSYEVMVAGSGATPTGQVTLLADGYPFGSAQLNASGQATLSGNLMLAGSFTLSVLYNGDTNYAMAQSGSQTLTIAAPPASTVTTFDVSATSFAQGSSPVLTAVVTGNGETTLPTGTVLFAASGYPLGTAIVANNRATITVPAAVTAMAGTYSISAAYSGDATHGPSQAIFAGTVTTAGPVPAPVFSRAAGAYTTGDTVAITDGESGAVIHYTTNGTSPTASSAVYKTPIAISSSITLQAVAIVSGSAPSPVTGAAYQAVSGISDGSGFSSSAGLTLNGSAAISGGVLQLINGGLNQAGSAWTATPVSVSGFTTEFQFQILNPAANGFTFTLQGVSPTALGSSGAGLGYQGITNSLALKFDLLDSPGGFGSIGYYLNGASPTSSSADLTPTAMNLHSGDVFDMKLTYTPATGALLATFSDVTTGETISDAQQVPVPGLLLNNSAYAGFTAGSGTASADINILSWTYTAN